MKDNKRIGLVATLFLALIAVSIISIRYQTKDTTAQVIVDDLARLSGIFQRIDQDCLIISFDEQKNVINFLNVGCFTGSEVGPINLTYPKKWAGPYVADNPQVQGKEYQVVLTKKGYFITPGNGVKLPNGKVVGKDIMFDENADIQAMMSDSAQLMFEGKALAAPLILKSKYLREMLASDSL